MALTCPIRIFFRKFAIEIKTEAMKYPIGIQSFDKVREGGFVYVDKTDLIYDLTHKGTIYFLSRPRRFGKSLLVSTLKAYFEGKKELFKNLKIDALEKDWKQYPVFHLDFNGYDFLYIDNLLSILTGYVKEWEAQWGKDPYNDALGDRFAYVLHQAHEQTGLPSVVLIDEYDKPMLDVLDTGARVNNDEKDVLLEEYNRNLLKGFYSVFKKADADLQFVFLTGVTKFSQITVFSGFNQPNDISMDTHYDSLCGITKEELSEYFAEPIKQIAGTYGVTTEDMEEALRKQYDGYHFSSAMTDIFNPFSILNAFSKQELGDYWFQSGTPTYLIRLLNHSHENLNEMTGKYYATAQFIDYKADVEKPLPMFYQSGYLTIKDVKRKGMTRVTYKLDFPNDEVKNGFLTVVANNYLKSREDVRNWADETVDALDEGDTEKYKTLLTSFLSSIPYSARRHENEREQERCFQYTIYLLMRIVSCYTVYHEKETSQGRADCVVETPNFVYIFEYKLDRPAAEALAQIEEKGYALEYANDKRKVYKIACCFSSKTGTVSEFEVKESSLSSTNSTNLTKRA